MNQRLNLPVGDVRYLFLTLPALPDGATVDAQVGSSSWVPVDLTENKVLVRGPSAGGTGGILVTEDGPLRVRFNQSPETITEGVCRIQLQVPSA